MHVAVGTFLAGVVGALVGVFVAIFGSWTGTGEDQGHWFMSLTAGLIVGGVSSLFLGWFMAMHGGGLALSGQRASNAPAWGGLTGLVYGLGLGPAFGAICGVCIGLWFDAMTWNGKDQSLAFDLLKHGGLFGLYLGPIVSIVGWESAYFLGLTDTPSASEAH